MKFFYIFIDGIGMGREDPSVNPFSRFARGILSPLSGRPRCENLPEELLCLPADAHLGVEGIPQSATGQTALWTGLNGPEIMGYHKTGLPGPTLIKVIHEYSILKQFVDHGRKATLINAYSENYLERLALQPRLASVSTHLQIASNQVPFTFKDLEEDRAIYMDITHEVLHQMFPEQKERFPVLDARERGHHFVKMARMYDLVIFEYFLTDKAGHDRSWSLAAHSIHRLEEFLQGITEAMDPSSELLLVTSDHGNLEDLSTKSHTHNPVPVILYGSGTDTAAGRIQNLMDVPRWIYDLAGIDVQL